MSGYQIISTTCFNIRTFFVRISRHPDIKSSGYQNILFDAMISGYPETGVSLYETKLSYNQRVEITTTTPTTATIERTTLMTKFNFVMRGKIL